MPSKNVKGKGNGDPGSENGNSEKGGGGSTRSDFLKDFDVLAPPRRIAKLGGEEIDVSMMSARVSLKLVSFENKYNFSTKNLKPDDFDPQMLDDMVDIIAMICQKSSKKITADWLLDNLELPVLIEFMQYVFEPMFSRMKLLTPSDSGAETGQEGTGKN